MDDVRLFLCARCQRQVLICSRCDRGQQYCGAHCSGLVRGQSLRAARRRYQQSRRGRHCQAAPSAKALFAAAKRHHLGVIARGLIELLNAYGPVALERAIAAALDAGAAHLAGVRHTIDQHRQQSDTPPPLPLALPDDPRLRALSVRPHDLADYDRLHDASEYKFIPDYHCS